MDRSVYSSGGAWEAEAGYSRAVRVGRQVFVAGTTATDSSGGVLYPGDAYGQSRQIFKKIRAALEMAGARLEHTVRTRMFVRSIADFEAVANAHRECFRDIRPAATLVEVSAMVDPAILVEIEADAVISD